MSKENLTEPGLEPETSGLKYQECQSEAINPKCCVGSDQRPLNTMQTMKHYKPGKWQS